MSGCILDKRTKSTNRSADNRKRFIERHKAALREQLLDDLDLADSIFDMKDETEKTQVYVGDLTEPVFELDHRTGKSKTVRPGNTFLNKGDKLYKPKSSESEPGYDGEDAYLTLTDQEYLELLFDNCELPNLLKKQAKDISIHTLSRSGFSRDGARNKLSVIRSIKESYLRRIAQRAALLEELEETQDEELILELKKRLNSILFMDDLDLRYVLHTKKPVPRLSAVVAMIMDVSGSISDKSRLLAKMFFYILYRFVCTKYAKVECLFFIHTDKAYRVDDQEFFSSTLSGGTQFLPVYQKVDEVLKSEYPVEDYNIYISHFTDCDTFGSDLTNSFQFFKQHLKPVSQFSLLGHLAESGHFSFTDYKEVSRLAIQAGFIYNKFYSDFPSANEVAKQFIKIFKVNHD